MRWVLLVLLLLGVMSCNDHLPISGEWSFGVDLRVKEICLHGVTYYWAEAVSGGGMAVALDADGKPIPCEVPAEKGERR